MRVHISFHNHDVSHAQEVAHQLRNAGHEPCFDNIFEACGDIHGTDFSPVARKMRSYDYMVAIISVRYNKEIWLQKELYGASTYEQSLKSPFIIPVVIEDAQMPLYVSDPVVVQNKDPAEWLPEILKRMVGLTQSFVIMKFGDPHSDDIYEFVYKRVTSEFGLTSLRIDQVEDSDTISHQVLKSIDRSLIIIADLTDERPNCYYEAGYADAKGKPVILTAKDGQRIHFDLAGRRVIFWKTQTELLERLQTRLTSMREEGVIPDFR